MRSKLVAICTFSIGALCACALRAQSDPAVPPAGEGAETAAPAPAAPDATAAPSRSPAFFSQLSPFGTWIASGPHGPMWVPANVAAGWQPYTLGHWAVTSYGWTWMSDEPFGNVTYHYGRWFKDGEHGWAWLPADDFAPAWVDWRSGKGYVGWAPLPPDASVEPPAADYTFVKEDALLAPRVADVLLPEADDEKILESTDRVSAPLLPGERPGRFTRALPYIVDFLDAVAEGLGATQVGAHGHSPTSPPATASTAHPTPPPSTAHPTPPPSTAHPIPPPSTKPPEPSPAAAHPAQPPHPEQPAPTAHATTARSAASQPAASSSAAPPSERPAAAPPPAEPAHQQPAPPPPAPPAPAPAPAEHH